MRQLFAPILVALALLAPVAALAHPHIVVQQVVRVVAKDGKYTHVEIEWRFDPYSSEVEIPLIDEDKNGKFSPRETKLLESEMMPELGKYGYLSWLNTGAKDFRPPKAPQFSARIDDPASFTLPDWDRSAGSLRWSTDGKTLVVDAEDLGQHRLFAIDLASSKASQRLRRW